MQSRNVAIIGIHAVGMLVFFGAAAHSAFIGNVVVAVILVTVGLLLGILGIGITRI